MASINDIINGWRYTSTTIYYSYSLSNSVWNGNNFQTPIAYSFDAVTKTSLIESSVLKEQSAVSAALMAWDSISAVNFTLTTGSANLVVYHADTNNSLGLNANPYILANGYAQWTDLDTTISNLYTHAEIAIDESLPITTSGQAYYSVLHEIGHAMGLKGDAALPASYTTDMTVMSYRVPGTSAADARFAVTPMAYDIAALEAIYGFVAVEMGSNTYGNSYFTGAKRSFTIKDDGGTDTFDLSGYNGTAGVTIDLNQAIDASYNWLDKKTIVGDEYVYITRGTNIENAIGTSKDDTIYGNGSANELTGGLGDDTLTGGTNFDRFIINTGDGTDTITDPEYYDRIIFNGVSVSGVAIRVGNGLYQLGDFFLQQENLDLFITLDATTSVILKNFFPATYDGTTTFSNAGITYPITGTSGNDLLGGSAVDDVIYGLAGDDYINGGNGSDILNGGTGSDIIDGNEGYGIDIVSYAGSSAGVTVSLLTAIQSSGGDAQVDVLYNIEGILGSSFNDMLTGDADDNTLEGGGGGDIIDGGLGIDIVSYLNSASAVNVNLALSTYSGGDAQDDVLLSIENLTGSAFNDILTAFATNTTLNGGLGNDALYGGTGNDILNGNEDNDTLDGGSGNDYLHGHNGNDVIYGGAGDDVLDGGNGNDILDDGSGNDKLLGGPGADVFVIRKDSGSNDLIMNFSIGVIEAYGEHIKLLGFNNPVDFTHLAISQSGANTIITLENSQTLILQNVLATSLTAASFAGDNIINGTASNDVLNGTDGMDVIYGLVGADIINGFAGADTIYGGLGADVMNGGDGIDTVSYDGSTAVNINLALTTAQSWSDATGDILSGIENIIGSAYSDSLYGDASTNVIYGGAGNDIIYSRDGDDTVYGNDGNDTINGGTGVDIIYGGNGNDILYGNDEDDVIYGDDGNDALYGQGENNILIGGSGADALNGFTGVSIASYSTSATTVNINLATNINSGGDATGDLIYGINNVIGSASPDVIVGNSSANILTGGSGADTLTGSSGADIFKYLSSADSGTASGLRDIITDFVKGSDKIDVVNFVSVFNFISTNAFTGTAQEINYVQVAGNTIVGLDADGNGTLDMQIELTGLHNLTASDFLL